MRFIVPAALPRLARLLEEVGLAVDVRADVAAVEGPLGPIPLRSGFPLHQLREVLRAARLTVPGLTARGAVGPRITQSGEAGVRRWRFSAPCTGVRFRSAHPSACR